MDKSADYYMVTEEGIIVLREDGDISDLQNIKDEDISIEITDYGISIVAKEINIPIPENLLDHLAGSGKVTICKTTHRNIAEAVLKINLPVKSLLEAKGAYRAWRQLSQKGKK